MPDRGPNSITDSINRRGGKLRLFAVLAGVMLVLAIAERAWDPDFRARRFGRQIADATPPIDTRLPPQQLVTRGELGPIISQTGSADPFRVDETVLARVEDDTLLLRPAERECWLLLQSRVLNTPAADLERQSLGEIGFTQLFTQPALYRGRVVTIRGTLMHAYRAAAPAGDLGIAEHYVLWIMPAGGPTSPIVVYALGLPAGFPELKPPVDGRLPMIREEVTVTGYFLKRGAYQATDGLRTAPLIIANVPQWHPAPQLASGNLRYGLAPDWLWPTVAAALAIALAVLGALYLIVFRFELSSRRSDDERLLAADFRGVSVGPSTHEALAQLEGTRLESELRGS